MTHISCFFPLHIHCWGILPSFHQKHFLHLTGRGFRTQHPCLESSVTFGDHPWKSTPTPRKHCEEKGQEAAWGPWGTPSKKLPCLPATTSREGSAHLLFGNSELPLPETRARQPSWHAGGLQLHTEGAWGRETGCRGVPAPARAAASASTSWRPALGTFRKCTFQHILRISFVPLVHMWQSTESRRRGEGAVAAWTPGLPVSLPQAGPNCLLTLLA